MVAYESKTSDDTQIVEVTTTQRIETLIVVPSATRLSPAILFVLVIILSVLVVSLKLVYPHDIFHKRLERLADMLALGEGSEDLSLFAKRHDIEALRNSGLSTNSGWFKDHGGAVRWGFRRYFWYRLHREAAGLGDEQDGKRSFAG